MKKLLLVMVCMLSACEVHYQEASSFVTKTGDCFEVEGYELHSRDQYIRLQIDGFGNVVLGPGEFLRYPGHICSKLRKAPFLNVDGDGPDERRE